MDTVFIALGMFLAGGLLGYMLRTMLLIITKNTLERTVSERLLQARETAQTILDEANIKSESIAEHTRVLEERLASREILLENRTLEFDERARVLEEKLEELAEDQATVSALIEEQHHELSAIAGMSQKDAIEALLADMERAHQQDLSVRMHKLNHVLNDTVSERAKNILTTAIQRLAVPTTTALLSSSVKVENEEMKGKIIGREGRNIRAFERASGTELLVDDVPGAIVVSCFDPVRRAIAVDALEALLKDGRIQPARIEEEVEAAKNRIHDIIKARGAEAVYELGIASFDPRLVAIIGRLHFRTSYGQNVLQHSIEMAHLASMIASEVGADPYIAKAGALVHDIGKALDHEFEGTHVEIGIKVLRRFNTDERIITAMKSHHDDTPHETLEAVIVQTADMISGARPGARRDTAEAYLKRLAELEGLAGRFNGVEKAYALQAGREIRIFVHPEDVSDIEAARLARDIALSIESELRYPGTIKVTIIRETRITDYAR
ncbi:MAG TPA: ribonuclease Y [Candidatus Paceibacterota bacterium]